MCLIYIVLFVVIVMFGLSVCNKLVDIMFDVMFVVEFVVVQLIVDVILDVLSVMMSSDVYVNYSVVVDLVLIQGNVVKGNVIFSVIDGKVYVKGEVSGFKFNSEYGFYIYEMGDCSVLDGVSVGGYFNLGKEDYGSVVVILYYGGDMFNIKVDV